MSAAPHLFDEPPLVSPAPVLTVLLGARRRGTADAAPRRSRGTIEHVAALAQLARSVGRRARRRAPRAPSSPRCRRGRRCTRAGSTIASALARAGRRASCSRLTSTQPIAPPSSTGPAASQYKTNESQRRPRSSRARSRRTSGLPTRHPRRRRRSQLALALLPGRTATGTPQPATPRRRSSSPPRRAANALARNAMFQASLVAERQRQWLLARFHAEQALEIYRRFGDTFRPHGCSTTSAASTSSSATSTLPSNSLPRPRRPPPRPGARQTSRRRHRRSHRCYLRTDRRRGARARPRRARPARRPRRLPRGDRQCTARRREVTQQPSSMRAATTEWLDKAERTFVELGSTSHLAAVSIARGDLARVDRRRDEPQSSTGMPPNLFKTSTSSSERR